MPRRRGPDGRPSLLETGRREILLEAIRSKGVRLQVAARLAGLSPSTVEEWVRRGEGRDNARPATPIYRKFADDVATAKAEFEAEMMAQVAAHARRDYNAAKFWLQANVPDVYGDRVAEPEQPLLGPSTSGPLITGGNIIVISPEQAAQIGLGQIRQQRIASGDSSTPDSLDGLVSGPDDDQR